jgi:putative membrane protein
MTDVQEVAQKVKPSKRELAGKYMGHTETRINKRRKSGFWLTHWYHDFIYDGRPDVAGSKTRKQHWEMLHSHQRFIQALFCYFGPPGHLLRNLALPMTMITVVTLCCAVYYGLQATISPHLPVFDRAGNLKILFQLGTFAVSLLLAMRINRTYERWWLGRQRFGAVSSNTTQAAQLIAVWCEDEALVQKFVDWMIVYHYSVMMQLLALSRLPPEAATLLSPEDLAVVNASKKPRQLASLQAHALLKDANLGFDKVIVIEGLLNTAAREGGGCARIKFQAMPYNVGIISTGFVFIWLLFLPLGLFGGVELRAEQKTLETVLEFVVLVIAFLFFALLLLACDEIANQLEDPFYQLPLDDIAKTSAGHMQRTIKEFKLLRKAKEDEEARLARSKKAMNRITVYDGPPNPPEF